MPSLVGTYIYGDFATGNIWALLYDADNKPTPKLIANVAGNTLVSFAQGNDGEVYTVQIERRDLQAGAGRAAAAGYLPEAALGDRLRRPEGSDAGRPPG